MYCCIALVLCHVFKFMPSAHSGQPKDNQAKYLIEFVRMECQFFFLWNFFYVEIGESVKEHRSRKFHLSFAASIESFVLSLSELSNMEMKLYFHDFWCWKFVKENILWYFFCRIHTSESNNSKRALSLLILLTSSTVVQKFIRLQFPHSVQLITFHLMNV